MKPTFPAMPGASVSETTPYCPRRSTCGRNGAKATCSWPRARSMAARADRSRGLFRNAKAMASGSAKIVRSGPGPWLGAGSAAGVPGSTTLSEGLTFRSRGTTTRAAAPAWVTSFGMGKGRSHGAHPATSSTGIRTRIQPSGRGTAAVKVEGQAIRAIRNRSLRGSRTGRKADAPVQKFEVPRPCRPPASEPYRCFLSFCQSVSLGVALQSSTRAPTG